MKTIETKKNFNWMKLWPIYASISSVVILIGIVSFTMWGFNLGVEFTGGTNVEYRFEKQTSSEEITNKLAEKDIKVESAQQSGDNAYLIKLGNLEDSKNETLKSELMVLGGEKSVLLRFEQVGPSVSQELIRKTLFAIVISATVILGWIAYQFKSVKFGLAATIATFHDALVVLGLFALFGHFFHAEIDFLFITALLTILSFSVHDTIVVYDRIREIRRRHGGNVSDVANRALSETMRRSIFNSVTIIIMLAALVILGGSTIRWFAVALLIGTISGTYSSPFVAVPLLVFFTRAKKH